MPAAAVGLGVNPTKNRI